MSSLFKFQQPSFELCRNKRTESRFRGIICIFLCFEQYKMLTLFFCYCTIRNWPIENDWVLYLKWKNSSLKRVFDIRQSFVNGGKCERSCPFPDAHVPFHLRSRVVYQFTCAGCNACYVGETFRHISTRIREHLGRDRTSHSLVPNVPLF